MTCWRPLLGFRHWHAWGTASLAAVVGLAVWGAPARGEVSTWTAIINEAQETPAPTGVMDSAAGLAWITYDSDTDALNWDIAWQDLTGGAIGMHFHGPAGPGDPAGVRVDIGSNSGLTPPSVGSTILTAQNVSEISAGNWYINIHTSTNSGGEIRGQVNTDNENFMILLDPSQETHNVTGVTGATGGNAWIAYDPDTNLLGWRIEWSDLTGAAIGMHFHGPALAGEMANVRLNIGDESGLTSPSIGTAVLSDEMESELLAGMWYLNIHTAENPSGEIRGQVVPEPSSAFLALFALVGMFGWARRR